MRQSPTSLSPARPSRDNRKWMQHRIEKLQQMVGRYQVQIGPGPIGQGKGKASQRHIGDKLQDCEKPGMFAVHRSISFPPSLTLRAAMTHRTIMNRKDSKTPRIKEIRGLPDAAPASPSYQWTSSQGRRIIAQVISTAVAGEQPTICSRLRIRIIQSRSAAGLR